MSLCVFLPFCFFFLLTITRFSGWNLMQDIGKGMKKNLKEKNNSNIFIFSHRPESWYPLQSLGYYAVFGEPVLSLFGLIRAKQSILFLFWCLGNWMRVFLLVKMAYLCADYKVRHSVYNNQPYFRFDLFWIQNKSANTRSSPSRRL